MGAMMKSAEEWAKAGKYSHCSFYDDRPICDCGVGNEIVCPKLAEFIRAIQADAIRAAAEKVNCGCSPKLRATCNEPGCGDDFYRDVLSLLPQS